MYKKIAAIVFVISFLLSSCGNLEKRVSTALGGNNTCPVAGCTSKPAPCNYDIITGKCK